MSEKKTETNLAKKLKKTMEEREKEKRARNTEINKTKSAEKSDALKSGTKFSNKTETINTKEPLKTLSGSEFTRKQKRLKDLKNLKERSAEKYGDMMVDIKPEEAKKYKEKSDKIIEGAKKAQNISEKIELSPIQKRRLSDRFLKKLATKGASKAGIIGGIASGVATAISSKDSMAAMPGEESGPAKGTPEYKMEAGKGSEEQDKQMYKEAMKRWRKNKLRR